MPVLHQRQVPGIRDQGTRRPEGQRQSQSPGAPGPRPRRTAAEQAIGQHQPLIALDGQQRVQRQIEQQGNHGGNVHIGPEGPPQEGEQVLELVFKDAARRYLKQQRHRRQQSRGPPEPGGRQPRRQGLPDQPPLPAGKLLLMLPKPDVGVVPLPLVRQLRQGSEKLISIHGRHTLFRATAFFRTSSSVKEKV